MTDDDRRAEIEAVRQVLCDTVFTDLPDFGGDRREVAEHIMAELDRVRDARGDDTRPLSPFMLRAADRLYGECERAVREGRIDARSPIGDATLDYREMREEGGPPQDKGWQCECGLRWSGRALGCEACGRARPESARPPQDEDHEGEKNDERRP